MTGVAVSGVVLVRRRTATHLLGGVLAGIALLSLYALGTRILPDRIGSFDSESFGYRLATPITYWNGLGIFTVMGALLAVAFAARGQSYVVRALAAATIPMLLLTNTFTFSRGAWLALGLHLSFSGITTFKTASGIQEAAKQAPAEPNPIRRVHFSNFIVQ